MMGWVSLPIMVLQGLSMRFNLRYTPIVWISLSKSSDRIPFRCWYLPTRSWFATGRTSHHHNDDGNSSNHGDCHHLAKNAFDVLAKKSKSWMRLGTIVELALDESFSNQYAAGTSHAASNSVCDVGTDHGLLATALAMTNRFDQVLGVDVSEVALREGALTLLNDIRVYRDTTTLTEQPKLPEFRLSDGLQNVHCGEADIVCVAGMGVHTMVDILTAVKTTGTTGSNNTAAPQCWLDVLETRRLILQPTNSRPRLLQHLYRHLHGMGWRARVERIHLVSSRWYFTVELERSNSTVLQIPGALAIATNTSNDAIDWVTHHQKWIHSDSFQTGSVNRDDALWLEEFAAI